MNNKFSERLLLLRKSRGLTQKQAAKSLGISQALLSHYEKGIRECGLDFVVKASEIFGCSADYILGISNVSPEKSAMPNSDNVAADLKKSPALVEGRKNSLQTLNLLYSITARLGNPEIEKDFNSIIYSDLYILLRALESEFFDNSLFEENAVKSIFFAKSLNTNSVQRFVDEVEKMKITIDMDENRLKSEYPLSSISMKNIVTEIENEMKQRLL